MERNRQADRQREQARLSKIRMTAGLSASVHQTKMKYPNHMFTDITNGEVNRGNASKAEFNTSTAAHQLGPNDR